MGRHWLTLGRRPGTELSRFDVRAAVTVASPRGGTNPFDVVGYRERNNTCRGVKTPPLTSERRKGAALAQHWGTPISAACGLIAIPPAVRGLKSC